MKVVLKSPGRVRRVLVRSAIVKTSSNATSVPNAIGRPVLQMLGPHT